MPDILDMESEDVLAHYGVPGMRWGKRRGSSDKSGKTKASKLSTASEDHVQSRQIAKKKVHQMSNADLKRINERLQLERTYADLATKQKPTNKSMKFVKGTLAVGKTAQEAYNLYNGPLGKAVINLLK